MRGIENREAGSSVYLLGAECHMDYRRYSRWAEWGVAAAVAALHVVVFLWPGPNTLRVFPLHEILRDAQWISGMSLVLAWAALGPGRPLVRAVCLPIALGMLLLVWSKGSGPQGLGNFFPIALIGTSLFLLLGLIALGLQVRNAMDIRDQRPSQYSLRGLMLATTTIAAAFGTLEALRPILTPPSIMAGSADRVAIEVREMVLGSSVAVVAIGSLWVVLQSGALWLRTLVVGLLVLSASVYLAHLTEGLGSGLPVFALHFIVAFSAIALLSGITALPLRLMGYRLQTSQP